MAKKITAKDIREESKAIHANVRGVSKAIHTHLMRIARHVFDHGDVTEATFFIKPLMAIDKKTGEMNSTVRVTAIKDWLETFGMCKWNSKEDQFKINSKMRNALHADNDEYREHFKQAAKTPWNKLTAEKKFNGFDLEAALKAVLTRASEAEEKARDYVKEHGLPSGYENTEAFVADKVKLPDNKLKALRDIAA